MTGSLAVGECLYLKDQGKVTSDADVCLRKEGVEITGKGFEWTIKEQRIIILSNVKVVLARASGTKGVLVSPNRKQGNDASENGK